MLLIVSVALLIGGLIVVCRLLGFGEFDGPPVFSPDGRFAISVTESNCGATCSFNAMSVMKDEMDGGRVTTLVRGDIHPCEMIFTWDGSQHLTVQYATKGVDLGPKSWHGVTIDYELANLPASQWASAWNAPDLRTCYSKYYHQ